jgi:hypothetical protein
MRSLQDKVVAIHRSLAAAEHPHAFGGALALAWCTRQARGTSDIDVNIFVPTSRVRAVLDSLPSAITPTRRHAAELERDGQTRLYWDTTPVDVFLSTTQFHEAIVRRVSFEPFAGQMIPFLACSDLAVFKVFFNRRRDWADVEEMMLARTIDVSAVAEVLAAYLGPDDERIATLRSIEREVG